ncbi:hypothetical protein [Clostridium celatum]|uniref:Uncharacterized protein n=1 Tax=Clostridium celatum DSM 1785 TaxID=545697 RepID=L1Q862_9CLOT|nr:hypothetical protein [Clostridium celatum]EKY23890.1 hypothetical protein HMPREF0216_02850 [Clostridium celatum DSM 1785]
MAIVIKKNKELIVADEKLQEFIDMGYTQIDEKGKVIKAGKVNTIAAYQAENTQLKEEIDKLKAENIKLKKELESKDQEKKSKGKA